MSFSKFVVLPIGSSFPDSAPCGATSRGEQYIRVQYESGSVVAVSPLSYGDVRAFLAFSESLDALDEFAAQASMEAAGLDSFRQTDSTAKAIRRRWPVWRASGRISFTSSVLGRVEREFENEIIRFSDSSLIPDVVSAETPWTVDNLVIAVLHSPSWDSTLAGALFVESAETGEADVALSQ